MTTGGLAKLLDVALDRALIGYGNVGLLLRRHWWPADPAPDSLAGRTAIVTGARTGLGLATTIGLARLGAEVRMVVRDADRATPAAEEVHRTVPGAVVKLDECDVSVLDDVRRYAAGLTGPVHLLVHNAGVMPTERAVNSDGNELMFATHVLGPHLLTDLLRDRLADCAPSRVIWVSSGGMYGQRLSLSDPQYERGEYKPTKGYARTKRMQVVLAELWAERLAANGISVHAMHPGWADTPGVATSLPTFRTITRPILRDPAQGADTVVWLAAASTPIVGTGRFWHDRAARPTHYLSRTREDPAARQQLWQLCQELTAPVAR